MRKLTVTLAMLACLSVAGPALANSNSQAASTSPAPTNFWPGKTFYGELTGGTNVYYTGVLASGVNNTSTTGFIGWGWSGALGYNFTSSLALEGGLLQNYVSFEKEHDGHDTGKSESGHTNIPYLAARFTVPFDRFAFIPKLGVMYINVVTSNNKADGKVDSLNLALPFVGLGVGYAITPHVQLVAQYQGAVYGIIGAGLMSLGLDYRF